MKSQMLLEKLMRLDNISKVTIYRINDNYSELNTYPAQKGLNDFISTNKADYVFL